MEHHWLDDLPGPKPVAGYGRAYRPQTQQEMRHMLTKKDPPPMPPRTAAPQKHALAKAVLALLAVLGLVVMLGPFIGGLVWSAVTGTMGSAPPDWMLRCVGIGLGLFVLCGGAVLFWDKWDAA